MSQSTNSIMRRQEGTLGQSAVGHSFLDATFHRAQARLKTRKAVGVKRQKAVAALFSQPATGEAQFYDLPAYLRKRIHEYDLDNHCRAAAYAERVRAHIEEIAA